VLVVVEVEVHEGGGADREIDAADLEIDIAEGIAAVVEIGNITFTSISPNFRKKCD
jgi:hypothetical protein